MCNQMYFTCSLIFILLLNWGPASARKLSEGPGECNCALFANDVKKVLKWQDFRPADRNQSKAEACTGSLETGSCQREKHKANCGNKNLLLICLTQISCKSAGVWGLEWIRFLKLLKLGLVVCPEQQKTTQFLTFAESPNPHVGNRRVRSTLKGCRLRTSKWRGRSRRSIFHMYVTICHNLTCANILFIIILKKLLSEPCAAKPSAGNPLLNLWNLTWPCTKDSQNLLFRNLLRNPLNLTWLYTKTS
jgi:hypothetical protein